MNGYGPYHRVGAPGGPGCPVGVLPIMSKSTEGELIPGLLLDAGKEASELELLRTIAMRYGVQWGHDDLGWWAAVKTEELPNCSIWKKDENGNDVLVYKNLTKYEAIQAGEKLLNSDENKSYWVKVEI